MNTPAHGNFWAHPWRHPWTGPWKHVHTHKSIIQNKYSYLFLPRHSAREQAYAKCVLRSRVEEVWPRSGTLRWRRTHIEPRSYGRYYIRQYRRGYVYKMESLTIKRRSLHHDHDHDRHPKSHDTPFYAAIAVGGSVGVCVFLLNMYACLHSLSTFQHVHGSPWSQTWQKKLNTIWHILRLL